MKPQRHERELMLKFYTESGQSMETRMRLLDFFSWNQIQIFQHNIQDAPIDYMFQKSPNPTELNGAPRRFKLQCSWSQEPNFKNQSHCSVSDESAIGEKNDGGYSKSIDHLREILFCWTLFWETSYVTEVAHNRDFLKFIYMSRGYLFIQDLENSLIKTCHSGQMLKILNFGKME